MGNLFSVLQNPAIKMSLIALATAVKFYTPDEIDKLIDDALLIFLGYHAMGTSKSNNG